MWHMEQRLRRRGFFGATLKDKTNTSYNTIIANGLHLIQTLVRICAQFERVRNEIEILR